MGETTQAKTRQIPRCIYLADVGQQSSAMENINSGLIVKSDPGAGLGVRVDKER